MLKIYTNNNKTKNYIILNDNINITVDNFIFETKVNIIILFFESNNKKYFFDCNNCLIECENENYDDFFCDNDFVFLENNNNYIFMENIIENKDNNILNFINIKITELNFNILEQMLKYHYLNNLKTIVPFTIKKHFYTYDAITTLNNSYFPLFIYYKDIDFIKNKKNKYVEEKFKLNDLLINDTLNIDILKIKEEIKILNWKINQCSNEKILIYVIFISKKYKNT